MSHSIRKFHYHGEESLSLPAERDAFRTLKSWIETIAEELNISEKTKNQLLIATDEIFTNIASYGYPKEEGTASVTIEFNTETETLKITFADRGMEYNPLDVSPPDITQPLDERDEGGLGIFMVQQLMDNVEYKREEDHNILIMSKIISAH